MYCKFSIISLRHINVFKCIRVDYIEQFFKYNQLILVATKVI